MNGMVRQLLSEKRAAAQAVRSAMS